MKALDFSLINDVACVARNLRGLLLMQSMSTLSGDDVPADALYELTDNELKEADKLLDFLGALREDGGTVYLVDWGREDD